MPCMPDSPSQSLIVRLPADKARQIVRLVDLPGSAYQSVDEFIRVAIENQLTLEGDLDWGHDVDASTTMTPEQSPEKVPGGRAATSAHAAPKKPSRVPAPAAPVSESPVVDEDLLRRPAIEGLTTRAATPTSGQPISSFTNRLAPVIAGPRVLANLSIHADSPSAETFLDLTAKASRNLGLRLRTEDDAANRRGRLRRSTAWPVGDDESKSLIRYRNCFMFSTEKEKRGSYTGPLLDLGLVTVADGKVFLTENGASFATALSPAIDESTGVALLSDQHRDLLAEAVVHIPGELLEVDHFLSAVERTSGFQDDIDKALGVRHNAWSEAQVVSHRAAIVGRLRDLAVIDIETDPKTVIVPGPRHTAFLKLISAAQQSGHA